MKFDVREECIHWANEAGPVEPEEQKKCCLYSRNILRCATAVLFVTPPPPQRSTYQRIHTRFILQAGQRVKHMFFLSVGPEITPYV